MHTNLEMLELPESLQKLGSLSFANCAELATVFLPEHKIDAEENIFKSCKKLYRVVGMQALVSSESPFEDCGRIKDIKKFIASKKVIKHGDLSQEEVAGNYVLPETVVAIAEKAFYEYRNIKSFKGSANLKLIKNNAFYDALNLEFVDLSECTQLEYIGSECFCLCRKLKKVILPDVPNLQIDSSAFLSCSNLEEIVLPSKLKQIPTYCFRNCAALKHVDLPANLRTIAHDAFMNSGITELRLPDRVVRLGKNAFSDCDNLKYVELSTRLQVVPELCFCGCSQLEKVVAKDNLAAIDEQAFGNCSKLADFEVKSNDPGFDQYEDIVYDPEAFTGSPYNEILEAAGIKKPNYDTSIYESRRR